jgi:chitinase
MYPIEIDLSPTVDWEHPKTPSQGDDFIHLLRATRAALPSPKYQLTTALPMGQYCLKHINLPAAAQELDLLNLMGYDFAGAWTELSGHHSQLFPSQGDIPPSLRMSCYSGVEYVLSHGFPGKKLVLGIPAYARFFQGATGPGQPFHGSGELDYEDLPPEWIEKAQIDQVLGAAYYVDCEEKGFMSYDVPSTVRMKADFVRKMDLAGLFYWTGIGDTKGPNSLVASGYHALNGTQV